MATFPYTINLMIGKCGHISAHVNRIQAVDYKSHLIYQVEIQPVFKVHKLKHVFPLFNIRTLNAGLSRPVDCPCDED